MIGQFNGADVTVLAQRGDPHPGRLETRDVIGIHAVVAEVARLNGRDSVDSVDPGTGDEPDRMEVVKERRVARGAW